MELCLIKLMVIAKLRICVSVTFKYNESTVIKRNREKEGVKEEWKREREGEWMSEKMRMRE